MTILFFIFLCGGMYYFRRFIIKRVILVFLFVLRNFITFYTWIKSNKDQMYRLEYKKLDEYIMDKYHLIENDKTHTIIFMSNCNNKIYDQVVDFKTNQRKNLENKNKIVHCSILDGENIIMDLTDLFRRFCYYYDKDYTLKGFFKYVEDHKNEFKKNMTYINIYDYNFVIYLNDNEFTEISYSIKDIINNNKRFNELILFN